MKRHIKLSEARAEADSALLRHKNILKNIETHAISKNEDNDEFLYLMSIPVIYAAWEGFFRISCSICLRRKFFQGKKIKSYDAQYAALWLQKQSFLNSFLDKLFSSMNLGNPPKKSTAGRYHALVGFTGSIVQWLDEPANHLQNFDDLVMTHSNVNKDVALINSEIIGLDISQVNFGRLNDLLGRRNDIAHGGLIDYPSKQVVEDLIRYADCLLDEFNSSVKAWLSGS
jgi:hypothetical protein